MTISDKSILEFAKACAMTAKKVDALSELSVDALETIASLNDKVTFLTGFATGQQSRIEAQDEIIRNMKIRIERAETMIYELQHLHEKYIE